MSLSLAKGSSLSLKKDDGSNLSLIRLGLGWDAKPKRGLFGFGSSEVDLDASAILFDSSKRAVEVVYYGKLQSSNRAVVHSGDNLTGEGEGDDEVITVNLSKIPTDITSIVFVITSYSSHRFDGLENVFARVVDVSAGEREVARYDLAERGKNTANIIACVYREGNGWAIKAIGNPANGRTPQDVLRDAVAVA